MFTDIVGYASLTQKDESLSLELLQEHRQLVRPSFSKYDGREIKTIGDAFLVEFPGPVEALRCAFEMQQLLHHRNLVSQPSRKISIRVGIHFGDVVYTDDGKDVYGNCVNIASRVEPLAEPGGICVTGQVYELTRSAQEFRFENLGEHDLKNIEVPIGIFKVVMPWDVQESDQSGHVPTKQLVEMQAPPFVGRDSERAKLDSILQQAMTSRDLASKVIFIGGEAGIGKTRLMDWLLRQAMQQGANVARGYCQVDVSVPYFSISEALGRYLSDNQNRIQAGRISFSNWLRTSTKSDFGYEVELGRTQMFEATARLLARLSEKRLLLLCLEDIHWADTGTIALLHYLGRNCKEMNILLVCTYRTEDLAGESQSKPHPLKEALQLMTREGICTTIELGRLGSESIREIVDPILGASSGGLPLLLAEESEGNPLFAVEYARLLIAEHPGDLVGIEKVLTGIPESVQGIIARRLDRLSPEERRLVDCASVLGEKFEPLLLADAIGGDRLSTVEMLDRIARETKILREEVEGRDVATFRFDHTKIREVILKGMTASLRQELHRRAAEALDGHYHDERVEEIAFHYREARLPERSRHFALVAGDRARGRFANSEAVEYYGWALEGTGSSDSKSTDSIHALLGRAGAYLELGLSRKSLLDAQEVLRNSTDRSSRIKAIRVCGTSLFGLGKFTESLDYCNSEEVRSRTGGDDSELLGIDLLRARITGYRGEPAQAAQTLREIGTKARALGAKSLYGETLLSMKEFQLTLLDLDGASESARDALAIYEELGDREGEMSSLQSLAGNSLFRGDIESADSYYERAAELGKKLGLHGSLVWIYLYWGLLHESAGDYQAALELSLKALDSAKMSELPYVETAVWANLTRMFFRAKRVDEAEDAYSRMNREFEGHASDASLTLRAAVQRSRGFYLEYHKRYELADKEYTSSIELLRSGPLGPFHQAETSLEYARFLLAQDRVSEARKQLEKALTIYKSVGNDAGVERIRALVSERIPGFDF